MALNPVKHELTPARQQCAIKFSVFPEPAVPRRPPELSQLYTSCLPQGEGEERRAHCGGQSQQPLRVGGQGERGPSRQVRASCHRVSEEICWLGWQVSPGRPGCVPIGGDTVASPGLLAAVFAAVCVCWLLALV